MNSVPTTSAPRPAIRIGKENRTQAIAPETFPSHFTLGMEISKTWNSGTSVL
jgi:hypothetical protein